MRGSGILASAAVRDADARARAALRRGRVAVAAVEAQAESLEVDRDRLRLRSREGIRVTRNALVSPHRPKEKVESRVAFEHQILGMHFRRTTPRFATTRKKLLSRMNGI